MINIDTKLLEALKSSTCFGIAHDETVPECKQCDVRAQCKVKSEGELNIPVPKGKPMAQSTKEVAKKETPKKPAPPPAKKPDKADKATQTKKPASPPPKKAQSSSPGDMPDFKVMQLDELKALANLRKVEWKDYGNDQITRMRLIMALKKSY